MPDIDPCKFHAPHKEWSGDPQERENWSEVERWSERLAKCMGTCTCAVLEWNHSFSIPDTTPTVLTIPGTVAHCGSPDPAHFFIVTFGLEWQGNNTGVRDIIVIGIGEAGGLYGSTVPGCTGMDGQQRMNVTKMFPAHLNFLSPKYQVTAWQTSGVALNLNCRVLEYYPCCDCDWAYGC